MRRELAAARSGMVGEAERSPAGDIERVDLGKRVADTTLLDSHALLTHHYSWSVPTNSRNTTRPDCEPTFCESGMIAIGLRYRCDLRKNKNRGPSRVIR
jgi:hypothetical protein